MVIGIDISQMVYAGTGVGTYVKELVRALVRHDTKNHYVLFGSSLRKKDVFYRFFESLKASDRVTLRVFSLPPTLLDLVWNTFHVLPIELFIGNVDIFWSSDWTQPPLRSAKGITTIHDVSYLRYPETFSQVIVDVQKRRMKQAQKECSLFLCDSEATKKDVQNFFNIPKHALRVVYPGFVI
jgi:hypothetical protein